MPDPARYLLKYIGLIFFGRAEFYYVSVNVSYDLLFRGGETQNDAKGEEHLAVILLFVTSGLNPFIDVGELTLSPERYP